MKESPLAISGIYPHLAVWNHAPEPEGLRAPQPECGIGAVVPWAGKLWFLTYTSHALYHGHDKLYALTPDLELEARPESVGGTHACRMIHAESGQLFIGCYAIDAAGRVRVIDREALPGRLTAVARHLQEPARKVYYYTQECSLYELDVATLEARLLATKPLPGWHAKGAYTAQGVLVVSHNGEEPAPSPFWKVDYNKLEAAVREAGAFLQVPDSNGPEDWGVLGEWDGAAWRVISRRQHTEVMGPGGLTGAADPDEPIWAQGWDRRSALLHVRHAGTWTRWRLPKGSYTYDGWNGSYTEWPRIRKLEDGPTLMTMHGTFFAFPDGFRPGNTAGLRPLCTFQRYIPDFCSWEGRLVLAGQDASRIGVPWAAPGHPHSNLQFISLGELETWGPKAGFGCLWREDEVAADAISDPFLVQGYDSLCLHLANLGGKPGCFVLEADYNGEGDWCRVRSLELGPSGCLATTWRAEDVPAAWIRLRAMQAGRVTAALHLHSPRTAVPGEARIFSGLARRAPRADAGEGFHHTVLQVASRSHNLCVWHRRVDGDGGIGEESFWEVDERLRFHRISKPETGQADRAAAAISSHVHDIGSALRAVGADGRAFLLPRAATDSPALLPCRDVREVIQERSLANLGGVFYEIPRYGEAQPAELRNLPDYSRMRPIAAHPCRISDFCVWRGLLVLGGVSAVAQTEGHIFQAEEPDGPALWFGAMDDLWKFGQPAGVGGPWLDTPIRAGEPSEPFLMAGFDRKTLTLSHRSASPVRFAISCDATCDGTFHPLLELEARPGETLTHEFPDGFQSHWVRLTANRPTVATAWFQYQ